MLIPRVLKGKNENLLKKGIVDKSVLIGLENMIKYMPDFGSEMYVEAKKEF